MDNPAPVPPDGALDAAIAALRYALARLDQVEREAAGEHGAAIGLTMPVPATPLLADLVIAARCVLAERSGFTSPAEQHRFARESLELELGTQTAMLGRAGPTAGQHAAELPAVGGAREEADPEFLAALWGFIEAALTGTARRSRRDPEFARFLARMWAEERVQVHVAAEAITTEQAQAKVAELIEAQRALYGSLAAGDDGKPPRP
jgi:hypothetical protein